MAGVTWVFVVVAAVVVLGTLLAFVVPWGSGTDDAAPQPAVGSTASPSTALARGFGYLQVLPRAATRHAGVQHRLARAMLRVDAVDPHSAPRRIGEALLQAGFADGAARPASASVPTLAPSSDTARSSDTTRSSDSVPRRRWDDPTDGPGGQR